MLVIESNSIDGALIRASKYLLSDGIQRIVGGRTCIELPEPVCLKITNPSARLITIPDRKWNIFLAFAESLWIATGRNDISMISYYLNRLKDFSDDGSTMRGAYGPRFRCYNGSSDDYKISSLHQSGIISDNNSKEAIDQLRFVVGCFEEDINTRKAIIQLGDPAKDCFEATGRKKATKDFPCTRSLHFIKDSKQNSLNLIVHMRSNDLLWGASGVNIFNFTFIQEYVAKILGLCLGSYYHIADNLHYYSDHSEQIKLFSTIDPPTPSIYEYPAGNYDFKRFNSELIKLSEWEEDFRLQRTSEAMLFDDPFFSDWANVLYSFRFNPVREFYHPDLLRLIMSNPRVAKRSN